MSTFFYHHPYLVLSIILIMLLFAGLIEASKEIRRISIYSALLGLPTVLYTFLFVPGYWNPKRLFDWIVGVEDLLFTFSTGGIVILLILKMLTLRYSFRYNKSLNRSKFVLYSCICALFTLILFFTKLPVMHSTLTACLTVGLVILIGKKKYSIVAVTGLSTFTLFYGAFIVFSFILFPHFANQWNWENLTGRMIWKIPAEEFLWAIIYGTVWPLFIFDLFGVSLSLKKREVASYF